MTDSIEFRVWIPTAESLSESSQNESIQLPPTHRSLGGMPWFSRYAGVFHELEQHPGRVPCRDERFRPAPVLGVVGHSDPLILESLHHRPDVTDFEGNVVDPGAMLLEIDRQKVLLGTGLMSSIREAFPSR